MVQSVDRDSYDKYKYVEARLHFKPASTKLSGSFYMALRYSCSNFTFLVRRIQQLVPANSASSRIDPLLHWLHAKEKQQRWMPMPNSLHSAILQILIAR